MIMTVATELVETMDDPVGDEHGVFLMLFPSIMVPYMHWSSLSLVKIQLRQQFQRAVDEDGGRSAVLEQKWRPMRN